MRSAFGKKSEHFFEKLSSHFTTEDLRAVWAKKRKTFLKIFLFTLTTGDQLPVWPKTFEFFSLHLPPDIISALFGFDFQRNAAIVLMLENIKELRSVRLEGNEEDIELTLENGRKILAQAKAVEKSSSDFSHVRENLKKALISLSEGSQKADTQQLIFITNSPNPFNDTDSRSVFSGLPTRRSFSNLPPSAQQIVQKYLGDIDNPLDLQKFTVQVFPFETDDETERYKAVTQAVNDFIGSLNANVTYGLGKWLLQVWHDDIFINGTKGDASILLDKKDISVSLQGGVIWATFWKSSGTGILIPRNRARKAARQSKNCSN